MKRGGFDETDEIITKKRRHSSYDEASPTNIEEDEIKILKASCSTTWPEEDLLKLAENLGNILPKDDMISFNTRMERIDWTNVIFNNYSVEDCKQMWTSLHKHVRKFRLTKEIVDDVKLWIKRSKTKPPKASDNEAKASKHPDMPKQPPNSYLFYYQEQRHKIKRENPEFSCSDIAKLVGNQFNNLTSTQREKYEKQAAAAKEEYAGKIKEFYENHPECIPKKTRNRNMATPSLAPAKPRTAFEIFMEYKMEQEEEEIESKYGFTQKCRETWRSMSKEDLIFWINWAEEEYKVYLENLKTFLLANPNFDSEPAKPTLTKKEKKIKQQCSGKPIKPPTTAFQLFSRLISQNEECKSLNGRDIMTFISMKWRNCSDEDKEEYQKRVDQMWEVYETDFNMYLETLPPNQKSEVLKEKVNRKIKQEIKEELEDDVEDRIALKQPEAPPRTEFKYFANNYKGKNAKLAWDKLSENNKEAIRAELRVLKKKYILEYETFLKSMNQRELEEFSRLQKNAGPCVDTDDDTSSAPESDSLIEETSETDTDDE